MLLTKDNSKLHWMEAYKEYRLVKVWKDVDTLPNTEYCTYLTGPNAFCLPVYINKSELFDIPNFLMNYEVTIRSNIYELGNLINDHAPVPVWSVANA